VPGPQLAPGTATPPSSTTTPVTLGWAWAASPSGTLRVTLVPVKPIVVMLVGGCGKLSTSTVTWPVPVRPWASLTVMGTMQMPPAGLAPPGQLARICVALEMATLATGHDMVAPAPTFTTVRPEPGLPANGSYSPATPTTVIAHVALLLASHCCVKVAPLGASSGATPTTTVTVVESPPKLVTETVMFSRVPGRASALASIDTDVPDCTTTNDDPL